MVVGTLTSIRLVIVDTFVTSIPEIVLISVTGQSEVDVSYT
jgi:hypothetical protein